MNHQKKVTFFDRLAVSFGCMLMTFFTSILAWLAIHWLFLRGGETDFLYLMKPIIVISLFAGFLGFLNKEGAVIDFLAPIWKSIIYLFKTS